MKYKSISIISVIFLLEITCYAGTLDLWISGINGQSIEPVKTICCYPGEPITLDVIYIGEPNRYLFSISSDIYMSEEYTGWMDISNVLWHTAFDPDLTGIQIKPYGAMMWAFAEVKGVQGENSPVVAVGNIQFYINPGPWNAIIKLRENEIDLTREIDDAWNIYEVDYGDGVVINYWDPPMRCDFDWNGKVDFHDFAIFANAWQSKKGDENWNSRCDLCSPRDNIIDISDLAVFANQYWLCVPWDCSCYF